MTIFLLDNANEFMWTNGTEIVGDSMTQMQEPMKLLFVDPEALKERTRTVTEEPVGKSIQSPAKVR